MVPARGAAPARRPGGHSHRLPGHRHRPQEGPCVVHASTSALRRRLGEDLRQARRRGAGLRHRG
eukprot:9113355-Lingulodinium_polyedra.AAC.1